MPPTLNRRLEAALLEGGPALDALAALEPVDHRDALLALLAIHDLHLAPVDQLGDRVRFQHHPAVAALKARLEARFLDWLEAEDAATDWADADDAVAAMRTTSARDLVPEVYA